MSKVLSKTFWSALKLITFCNIGNRKGSCYEQISRALWDSYIVFLVGQLRAVDWCMPVTVTAVLFDAWGRRTAPTYSSPGPLNSLVGQMTDYRKSRMYWTTHSLAIIWMHEQRNGDPTINFVLHFTGKNVSTNHDILVKTILDNAYF